MRRKLTRQQQQIVDFVVEGICIKRCCSETFNTTVNSLPTLGDYQKITGCAYQY